MTARSFGAPLSAMLISAFLTVAAPAGEAERPRFVVNANGTVTDNKTGLTWEMKTGTVGGSPTTSVHDVNNYYSWSAASPYQKADGTLFTTFLAGLNGGDYYNPTDMLDETAGPGTCFANHCDWRIPTIVELNSIIELTASGCGSGSPCIDSTFGPTLASFYWSSSSLAGSPTIAWSLNFINGRVSNTDFKNDGFHARAVRDTR